jgi:hypothetical protein
MTIALRFVVLQVLLLWQGGFLFYTAVVVPTGTKLLGAAGQGAITARVTDAMNAIGAVALAALALELRFTRDPNAHRTARRWWAWGFALLCRGVLIYLHTLLDYFMDDARRRVMVVPPFYPVHRMYLWVITVQWLACVLLTWWTLKAWREADRGFTTEATEKGKDREKN